jgi:mono/diheme cytochrome c family protein
MIFRISDWEGSMMQRFVLSAVVVTAALGLAMAQTVKTTSAPYTNPTSGKDMYKAYCASCHGVDGTGSGPAASAMKSPVPDLTQLSKKNGGKFPADHVASVIRGDSNRPSHGSTDMPVWGPVFMKVSDNHVGEAQLRVRNLADYIQSIQK